MDFSHFLGLNHFSGKIWLWVKNNGTILGGGFGAQPILEPILVVGLGCSLGANRAFDPWPCVANPLDRLRRDRIDRLRRARLDAERGRPCGQLRGRHGAAGASTTDRGADWWGGGELGGGGGWDTIELISAAKNP